MGDDVAAGEFGGSLGEDARDVERDIAVADHRDAGAVERRVEVGEIGVAIVPADEGGAADDAGQIGAGNPQRPVIGRPGREHDGVVELLQFVDPDVGADRHMADEAHIVRQGDTLVPPRHRLDRLVIGGNAGADQPIGNGQAIDHVDADILRLLQGFGGIISGRTRPDDRDMTHQS